MVYARTILCLLLLMWGVIAYATWRDVEHAEPGMHPTVPAMAVGGDRADADRQLVVPGALFGMIGLTFLLICLFMGAEANKQRSVRPFLLAGTCPVVCVFVGLFWSYSREAAGAQLTFWGGFPLATAFVVYGVWIVPVVFCVIYALGYHRWFAVRATQSDRQQQASV